MIENRAAILPYPGDPFLFNYWLTFYDKFWKQEVGKLYVYLNSPIESEVVDHICELCERRPNVEFLYNPMQIEHGDAINRTLDVVTEKYVMLIEDDCFVFKPGYIHNCFYFLECGGYEIVASKRGSCSQVIWDEAQKKWNLDFSGYGDQGPNFWPNLFFSTKHLLLTTDRNFGARQWNTGDCIKGLEYTVEVGPVVGDTFVQTSLELRGVVPEANIKYIPQYHAHPDDVKHYEDGQYLFDGKAPWTHIGSLSSGIGGLIRDAENRPLARRKIMEPDVNSLLGNAPQTDMEKKEYERRVQWWLTFYENREPGKIEEFAQLYYNGLINIVNQFGLSLKEITKRQAAYKTIGL